MKRLAHVASALAIVAFGAIVLLAGCAPTGFGFKTSKTETKTEEYAFDSFADIDADVDVCEIKLVQGKGYAVTVARKNYPKVNVDVKGDRLVIADAKNSLSVGSASCEVTITVPKDAQLKSVDLESSVGSISAEGISAATIKAIADVGEVDIDSCTADAFTLSSNVGSIGLHGVADLNDASIEARVDVGSIVVDGTEHSGSFSQPGTGTKIEATADCGSILID